MTRKRVKRFGESSLADSGSSGPVRAPYPRLRSPRAEPVAAVAAEPDAYFRGTTGPVSGTGETVSRIAHAGFT